VVYVHLLSGYGLLAHVALLKAVFVELFSFSLGKDMPFGFGVQYLVFNLLNKGAEGLVLKLDAMLDA
jgi:hypothetical protein